MGNPLPCAVFQLEYTTIQGPTMHWSWTAVWFHECHQHRDCPPPETWSWIGIGATNTSASMFSQISFWMPKKVMKSNLLKAQQIKRLLLHYRLQEEQNAVIPPCYMYQLTSLTHHWAVWWCPWGARPSHSSSASPDVRPAAGSVGRGEGGLQRSSALYQNCGGTEDKFN